MAAATSTSVQAKTRKLVKPAPKPALKVTPSAKPGRTVAKAGKLVKVAKTPTPIATAEPTQAPKQKLVRDSFTMPQADFDLVDVLKAKALAFQRPAKKSELLRAGLHALAALSDAQLRKSLEALTPLKAGRPKKAAPAVPAPKARN
jgi:hypothetical protein